MSATLNSQAVQISNQLIGIGQQLAGLENQISLVTTQWTNLSLQGVLNALPTAAVGSDGNLGAADGAINNAHVIDTRVVASLSRAISANDLASLNTLCAAVAALLAGSAVTQQGQSPGLLAKVVGG